MSNKLKFGNGTWATKKGSTLAYNDENDNYKPLPFATTRASGATRVNKEGLIEVVENDRPRIDYTDSAKGALLLEPQRTNQMINSEDLTGWNIQAGATITLESINNPVNSTNANLITANTNGAYLNRSTPDASALYSVSFWLHKNNQSGTIELTNAQGGNFGKWTINLDLLQNDFVRITRDHPSVTAVSEFTTLASGDIAPFFKSPSGTKSFYVTGLQLEPSYPTSYIPTQGATATRLADTAIGSGNSEVFNDSEGVLFANWSAANSESASKILTIKNSSILSNRVSLYYYGDGIYFDILNSSGTVSENTSVQNAKNFNKMSLQYQSGNTELWVNGFKVVSNTQAISLTGLDKIDFDYGTVQYPFYGKTKELAYYNTILTDLELETLTSYRSLSELVTELNLNTL
ncbi:hypothetical protein N9824_00385 [bacterium]|nr:hypothetical protein [bacterium]